MKKKIRKKNPYKQIYSLYGSNLELKLHGKTYKPLKDTGNLINGRGFADFKPLKDSKHK